MQRWLKEDWIGASARKGQRILWRAVEAQHVVATMSLVDTLDEQYLLEKLLEDSKPPMPLGAGHLDYLIFTPFRYTSPYPSRFRKPHEPGIWYGAFERETACAEVGYWRWRFLMNSDGLREGEVKSEHPLFQAKANGRHIDLGRPPWDSASRLWRDPDDYSHCHALAEQSRARGIDWIRYRSARHPQGECGGIFNPHALSLHEPTKRENWICRVTKRGAIFRHDRLGISIDLPGDGAGER
ncbi:MAG: RES family NAD+ phosphorylase [Candidatus Protistobacter heckmanni]|nr:RES family NAD+ phosphorylase [Candidatus Protistobacter heckmanni]